MSAPIPIPTTRTTFAFLVRLDIHLSCHRGHVAGRPRYRRGQVTTFGTTARQWLSHDLTGPFNSGASPGPPTGPDSRCCPATTTASRHSTQTLTDGYVGARPRVRIDRHNFSAVHMRVKRAKHSPRSARARGSALRAPRVAPGSRVGLSSRSPPRADLLISTESAPGRRKGRKACATDTGD